MTRARQSYVRDYWPHMHASEILRGRRRLVESRRASGWGTEALSSHQHKVALESAVGILNAGWRTTLSRAASTISRRRDLSEAERHWCLSAMRRPEVLQACLDRREAIIQTDWAAEVDAKRCARLVRRVVLRCRTSPPRRSRTLWFDVDTNLYRAFSRPDDRHFRGAWIALTGLTSGKRICLPLRGAGLDEFGSRTGRPESRPSLRVHVGPDRIVLATAKVLTIERRTTGEVLGVDKGLSRLVTVSHGDIAGATSYGTDFHARVARVADRMLESDKLRARLRAYERSLENSEPTKARRIRRQNLGTGRRTASRQRGDAMLRVLVNHALNELFAENPTVSTLIVESLDIRRQRFSRRVNRHSGAWLSGFLHRRLAYKAELNGVELKVVSAAYSSQSCPRCWFTSSSNRRGERFSCGHCGLTGSADAVAATNLLRRGSDPAITRYMPRGDVYRILEGRWRSARNGRAWGSNVEGGEPTWAHREASDGAANNRADQLGRDSVHTEALYPSLTVQAP